MTESNFETNTADEPQDSSITVSILGDDTGIIQNTLRAKGINTVHSVSNDTLNDVNASDHYRNLLKEQSPHLLIVAQLPKVPTQTNKRGRKHVRHMVDLVRQQMARGKHVILLASVTNLGNS